MFGISDCLFFHIITYGESEVFRRAEFKFSELKKDNEVLILPVLVGWLSCGGELVVGVEAGGK